MRFRIIWLCVVVLAAAVSLSGSTFTVIDLLAPVAPYGAPVFADEAEEPTAAPSLPLDQHVPDQRGVRWVKFGSTLDAWIKIGEGRDWISPAVSTIGARVGYYADAGHALLNGAIRWVLASKGVCCSTSETTMFGRVVDADNLYAVSWGVDNATNTPMRFRETTIYKRVNGQYTALGAKLMSWTGNPNAGPQHQGEFIVDGNILTVRNLATGDSLTVADPDWSINVAGHFGGGAGAWRNADAKVDSSIAWDDIQVFEIGGSGQQSQPPVEVCGDGVDNDLDGLVDEDCAPPDPCASTDDTPIVTILRRLTQILFRDQNGCEVLK